MNINAVSFQGLPQIQNSNTTGTKGSLNFSDILKSALDNLNNTQVAADQATQNLISGQSNDISQVMLSTEEAKLSLDLAVQIRNKFVDAYQEIMQLQL